MIADKIKQLRTLQTYTITREWNNQRNRLEVPVDSKKNMSQRVFAAELGIHFQTVQKWESGKAMPTFNMLLKMSERFNVPIEYFVENKQENNNGTKICSGKKRRRDN